MANTLCRVFLFVLVFSLGACSFKSDEADRGNHVWKSQMRALQKARDTEQLLANDVNEKKRKIEEQSQ